MTPPRFSPLVSLVLSSLCLAGLSMADDWVLRATVVFETEIELDGTDTPFQSAPYLGTAVVTETVWGACEHQPPPSPSPSPSPSQESLASVPSKPLSTELAASGAVLTGITVLPSSSPTSCYTLPIPTDSLERIAFSTPDLSALEAPSAWKPDFYYVDKNATSPAYMGTVINGTSYLLDLSHEASAQGHVALTASDGQSIVFNKDGMHVFDKDCGSVSSVKIDNFFHQMVKMDSTPPANSSASASPVRRLRTRDFEETDFTIVLQINKTLQKTIPVDTLNLTYGLSPCQPTSGGNGSDFIAQVWICEYPGRHSGERTCEDGFDNWLGAGPQQHAVGQRALTLGSAGDVFNFLTPMVNKTGPRLTGLLPSAGSALVKGIDWLGNAARKTLNGVIDLGGSVICETLHIFDEYSLVLSGPGLPSPTTLGAFRQPPAQTMTQFLGIVRRETDPPRVEVPTVTNHPHVTASVFNPISFLGGLFGRDVMPVMATVMNPAPVPTDP